MIQNVMFFDEQTKINVINYVDCLFLDLLGYYKLCIYGMEYSNGFNRKQFNSAFDELYSLTLGYRIATILTNEEWFFLDRCIKFIKDCCDGYYDYGRCELY